jgi:hypothetical protein
MRSAGCVRVHEPPDEASEQPASGTSGKGIIAMNRTALIACTVAALGLTGCTTDPQERGVLRGGGIGAAGGAIVGALFPGISVLGGAALGAAGGAAIGALTAKDKDGRRFYHDEHGRYYIDRNGERVYQ